MGNVELIIALFIMRYGLSVCKNLTGTSVRIGQKLYIQREISREVFRRRKRL